MRNSALGIHNPANDWNPKSEFHLQRIRNCIKYLVSGIHSVKSRIQDCLDNMLWLPFIQTCFTLGFEFRLSPYGDLYEALDVSAQGLSRNIPLRARKTFGTQGRLAIPFTHLFLIIGPYLILRKLLLLFTGVVQDIISFFLFLFCFFFPEDFDERTSETRAPSAGFSFIPPLDDLWRENRSVNRLWTRGCLLSLKKKKEC